MGHKKYSRPTSPIMPEVWAAWGAKRAIVLYFDEARTQHAITYFDHELVGHSVQLSDGWALVNYRINRSLLDDRHEKRR